MSELWLCREKTAQEPFWIAAAGIRIYTIEELCYYLYEDLYFLEESLMCDALFQWLRQELAMPRLAGLLSEGRKRGQNVVWCAVTILREAGCVGPKELADLENLCREMASKNEFECGKIRADRLLKTGRYVSCIRQYYRLLEAKQPPGSYPILIGNIWHNLGTAHAGLFLFEEAAGCFQKAFDLNQNPDSQRAYESALTCQKLAESGSIVDDSQKGMTDRGLEDRLKGAPMKTGGQMYPGSAKELEDYLMGLKEDYKKKVMEYGTV